MVEKLDVEERRYLYLILGRNEAVEPFSEVNWHDPLFECCTLSEGANELRNE
jgi:hypothetical protein